MDPITRRLFLVLIGGGLLPSCGEAPIGPRPVFRPGRPVPRKRVLRVGFRVGDRVYGLEQ